MKKLIVTAVVTACYILTNLIPANAAGPVEIYQAWNDDLKTYTKTVCEEYNVDQSLVLGVIYNESRFQSGQTHVNSNGTVDYGLMQVNEVNFDYLHKTLGINSMNELLDDRTGIRCGIQLLAYHKEYTDNDSSALLRYQIGAGKYKKYLQNGRYTNQTHQQVLTYQKEFASYLQSIEQTNTELVEQRMFDLFHRWSESTFICWSGAMAAQEICNFQVAGSSPVSSTIRTADNRIKDYIL